MICSSEKIAFIMLAITLFFSACEKEIVLDLPLPEDKIVIEGYIENGTPPYLFLTRNSALFATADQDSIEALFVRNALVTISNGTDTIQLKEYSASELGNFTDGQDIPDGFDFFLYTVDPATGNMMLGEIGKTYQLTVIAGADTIIAKTKVPNMLLLDSIWMEQSEQEGAESFYLLNVTYNDPDTLGNFARYFTSRNDEPFFPGRFESVFDDRLVNGKKVSFVLDRGESKAQEADWETYGYFKIGDTVTLKWCSLNKAHYEFWRSAEQQMNSSGNPFSTATFINDNIEGGIGVWGGYGCIYETIIVQ